MFAQDQWRVLGWDETNWDVKRHGVIANDDPFQIVLNQTNGFEYVLGKGAYESPDP